MTCTPLTDPLRHLLNRLAGTTGALSDSLNPDGLEQARRFGWVYEHQGQVASTGSRMVNNHSLHTVADSATGYILWWGMCTQP